MTAKLYDVLVRSLSALTSSYWPGNFACPKSIAISAAPLNIECYRAYNTALFPK